MDAQLEKILKLVNKTGEKVVVIKDDHEFVITSLDEYLRLIEGEHNFSSLSESEMLDKINRDIAVWRQAQQAANVENGDFVLPREVDNASPEQSRSEQIQYAPINSDHDLQAEVDRLHEELKYLYASLGDMSFSTGADADKQDADKQIDKRPTGKLNPFQLPGRVSSVSAGHLEKNSASVRTEAGASLSSSESRSSDEPDKEEKTDKASDTLKHYAQPGVTYNLSANVKTIAAKNVDIIKEKNVPVQKITGQSLSAKHDGETGEKEKPTAQRDVKASVSAKKHSPRRINNFGYPNPEDTLPDDESLKQQPSVDRSEKEDVPLPHEE
jgi:PHD/YefM family antitoxin component YafN of YafNO toxin-antitoxin module